MTLGEHNEYDTSTLSEADLHSDPLVQLQQWIDVAMNDDRITEPNAMTVATVDEQAKPSARIVLLRGVDQRGLSFYTNYSSRKGRELSVNPHIACVLFWPVLQRQVRIEGTVTKLSDAESDAYFYDRPIKSQLGAAISEQSAVIANRQVLEDELEKLEQQQRDGVGVRRPSYWGGYLVTPESFEFWQGRRSRLHDRLCYLSNGDDLWRLVRLAP